MSFTTLGRVSCWPHCTVAACTQSPGSSESHPGGGPQPGPRKHPASRGRPSGDTGAAGWPAQAPRTSASPHEELVLPGMVPTGVSESGRVGATSLYLTQPIN